MNPPASIVLALPPGLSGDLLRELVAADPRVRVLAEAADPGALPAVLRRTDPDAVVVQAPAGSLPPETLRLLAEFPRTTLVAVDPDGRVALVCALRLRVQRLDQPAPAAVLEALRGASLARAWFPLPQDAAAAPGPFLPGPRAGGGMDLRGRGPDREVHSAGGGAGGTSIPGPLRGDARAPAPFARALAAMPSVATIHYNQAVADLLAALGGYVPPAPLPPTPAPSLSVVSVRERGVGIGNHGGPDTRPGFVPAEVFGGRVEATVRFEVWDAAQGGVLATVAGLQERLRTDRDLLRAQGFLRLRVADTSAADPVNDATLWRQAVLCEVLYEYEYRDSDGADSLIARIPVALEGAHPDATEVAGVMARWDDLGAPPLVVRGPARVGALATLAFVPGPAPTGGVTLLRTFDGAAGPPPALDDLAAFLAAAGGPDPAARHAAVSFASLQDFLDAAAPGGPPATMGDWDEDAVPDEYAERSLALDPAVRLAGPDDRLELRYGGAALDRPAVLYLRALPGPA